MDIVAHRFVPADLVGGHVALDFVNTATGREHTPRDWLADYAALAAWASLSGACTASECTALRALAHEDSRRAGEALARARASREALYATFARLAAGERPDAASLQAIEDDWKRAARHATLSLRDGAVRPQWRADASALDLVRDRVAWASVQLLGDAALAQLKQCDGENCAWLFLDTSKNGRRRWCDMATCGNLAKARRHYERHRAD